MHYFFRLAFEAHHVELLPDVESVDKVPCDFELRTPNERTLPAFAFLSTRLNVWIFGKQERAQSNVTGTHFDYIGISTF